MPSRRFARTTAASVPGLCLVLALPAAAAPPGESLDDRVALAYSELETYRATLDFELISRDARWTTTQKAEFYLAFDRANQRLLVDGPNLLLVVDNGRLRVKSDQLPGQYLDTAIDTPLTFAKLQAAAPILESPPLPALVLLLADEPFAQLGAQPSALVGEQADGKPRLTLDTPDGAWGLELDPDTMLLTGAVMTVGSDQLGADQSMGMRYTWREVRTNQPLDDAAFAFDTQGLTAAGSFNELLAGAGGGGQAAAAPLVGEPAPELELKTAAGEPFKLSDAEHDVVVLDFWATWCPPCVEGLPKLQAVADWAEENNFSVGIYAVNLQETPEQATAFWERMGLSLPILMDPRGAAANAYRVEAIPQTVIIAGGKVVEVHAGLAPSYEQTLKQNIRDALGGTQ